MASDGGAGPEEHARRQVETPVFEAVALGALLVLVLVAIGVCLFLQGDRPKVVVALQATRSEAGKPMVMERVAGAGPSTPVPIDAMVGALALTGAPSLHSSAGTAAADFSIHVRRADCAGLVRSLGGYCRGPIKVDGASSPAPAQLALQAPAKPVHLRFSPGSARKLSITQSSLSTQQPIPSALTLESTPAPGASATVTCVHITRSRSLLGSTVTRPTVLRAGRPTRSTQR